MTDEQNKVLAATQEYCRLLPLAEPEMRALPEDSPLLACFTALNGLLEASNNVNKRMLQVAMEQLRRTQAQLTQVQMQLSSNTPIQ